MPTSGNVLPLLAGIGLIHLGLLFVAAGSIKLAEPVAFARYLDLHGVFSARGVGLVTAVVPAAEIALGLWLISGFVPGAAASAALALLASFLIYRSLVYRAHRGAVPCGCLGSARAEVTEYAPAEFAALVVNGAVAVAVAVFEAKTISIYATWLAALLVASIGAALSAAIALHKRRSQVSKLMLPRPSSVAAPGPGGVPT